MFGQLSSIKACQAVRSVEAMGVKDVESHVLVSVDPVSTSSKHVPKVFVLN